MMPDIMDLGMAVMATGNAVIGAGGDNLVKFDLAIGSTFLGISRLQETTATAAAVIVRFIRRHFDDIFFADHRLDNKAQIVGDRIAEAFANNLTRILDGEFDFQIFVPLGTDLQTPFTDPFGIILIDGCYFKVMINIEFFQSGPD